MKRAARYSAILHVIIFFFCFFGVPNPFNRVIKDDGLIVVEFATIGPKTTAPVISNDVPKEKPDETQPIAPQPKAEEPKKDDVKEVFEQRAQQAQEEKLQEKLEEQKKELEKKNQKLAEDAEAINLEKKKIEENKKKEEEKKQKEELKKKEDEKKKKELEKKNKEQEEKKKKEEAEKKKKKEGDKKAVVNLDNKDKKDVKSDKKKDPKSKMKSMDDLLDDKGDKPSNQKGNTGAQAEEIGDSYTAREVSLLRAHISKCWNVHAGAKDAKNHVVPIEIHIDDEGFVKKAEIVEKDRMKSDPFYRVAAESAQRSLYDPDCRQFPEFARGKEFIFNFNPKEMF